MPKAITDEHFGAWVIKCHPDVWDVMTFLELGHDHIDSWSIRKSYRTDLMKPGQPVVFWVSGPRDGDVECTRRQKNRPGLGPRFGWGTAATAPRPPPRRRPRAEGAPQAGALVAEPLAQRPDLAAGSLAPD